MLLMNKIVIVVALAAAATLGACTPKAQNATAEAANAVVTDVNATAAAAVNSVDAATDNAMNKISNAADVGTHKIDSAADKVTSAAGNALTDAGNSIKK